MPQILEQSIWVILAVATLLYILTNGFAFFRKPKEPEKKPVPQKNANPNTAKQQPQAQAQTANKSNTGKSNTNKPGANKNNTDSANNATGSNNAAIDKDAPAKPAATPFELEREFYKKSADIWRRCPRRNRGKDSELRCDSERYCLNEYVCGGCTNNEFLAHLSQAPLKRVQNALPYDELLFEEDFGNSEWPLNNK